MLAFRIRLNRKKLATAGIRGAHVLSAIITSVIRDAESRRLWPRDRDFRAKDLTFSMGGMIRHRDGAHEHMDWAYLKLKVGDTVTLKVVNTTQVDEPRRRRKTEGPTIEESERRELDRLQRKYLARAEETSSKLRFPSPIGIVRFSRNDWQIIEPIRIRVKPGKKWKPIS
jgi:hypothetical protein